MKLNENQWYSRPQRRRARKGPYTSDLNIALVDERSHLQPLKFTGSRGTKMLELLPQNQDSGSLANN